VASEGLPANHYNGGIGRDAIHYNGGIGRDAIHYNSINNNHNNSLIPKIADQQQ
jgi:hypothetical protein